VETFEKDLRTMEEVVVEQRPLRAAFDDAEVVENWQPQAAREA
jgi:hypothetical protein